MIGFESHKKLRDHRPLLLVLEAIGWLHMTGKAKIDFLREHGGQKNNYDYKKWHEQENPPFPWNDMLQWVQDRYPKNSSTIEWPDTLTAFIREHADGKSKPNLVGLLQAGHAMASGIEKQSFPPRTVEYLGQDVTHMWLSTAFGHPVRNLLDDPSELLGDAGWKRLLGQIEGLLTKLKQLGDNSSPNDIDGWWCWRDGTVGPEGWLRKAFTGTLAETRLPNNDVTLFDQSYVAAALFKSAAAGAILESNSFPWSSNGLKQQTRWRLLTIGIGADHYEARAIKIGDWTGARLAIDELFNEVCRLVEIDLAVGSLLYRDGEICVFSFPGERSNPGGDLQIKEWENYLQQEIDDYASKKAKFEMPPYCKISEEPSRSLVGMTAEIRKAREMMAVPLHRNWEIPGQDSSDGHVCPVCLVRKSKKDKEKPPSKQKPCEICMKRRTHRLNKWLKGDIESDTIWISEVADANDRVALITMTLDIEPWLDGTRLDSLRTQAISEWRKFNPELYEFWQRDENTRKKEHNPVNPDRPFDSLQQEIKKRLGQFKEDDLLLCNLQEGYRHAKERNDQRSDDEIWRNYFSLIVEDRASRDQPEWKNDDPRHNAGWLTHQLFRKLASPGRIYRFQRQAEEFFKALLAGFRETAAENQNRRRVRRLIFKTANSGSWEDLQPYAGRFNDTPLDLLYIKELGGFITISNLSRLLERTQGEGGFIDKTIPLKDDDNNPASTLTIKAVEELSGDFGHLGAYNPVISLDLSPVRFRVLVPLEAASACVDRALQAWSYEFSRVRDRLPIQIGVAAFPRKTPFQAVIDAVRNLEEDLRSGNADPEIWRVVDTEIRDGITVLSVTAGGSSAEPELWTMPMTLPDGREDVFYPYTEVEDSEARFPLDFRHPKTERIYRHVKDLKSGDGVHVYPSRVAFLFMDDTKKRFEPAECKPLKQWKRMRELWNLIDRAVPSRTALHGAWSELAGRRDAWKAPNGTWLDSGDEAWTDLVRAIFHERLGIRGAGLDTLVQAARDGLLEWCLEWHLRVLKLQVNGGKP